MTASEIVQLLSVRHDQDVFVPECKDGPTQMANHLRLDAWAMKRSWANPCFDGYEIKVSRRDFVADNKMHLYLALCNRLWVVCPHGLIQTEEIDPSMGLLWVTSTGNRLVTKRKAPYREIEPPLGLLLYILMCRTRVQREHSSDQTREERVRKWQQYLDGERSLEMIGWNVGSKMRADIRANLGLVEQANRRADRAEARAEELEGVRLLLESMGLGPGEWNLKGKVADALSGKRLSDAIRRAHQAIDDLGSAVGIDNVCKEAPR